MGSDNGLALNKWQAIIWINDGPVYQSLDELEGKYAEWLKYMV